MDTSDRLMLEILADATPAERDEHAETRAIRRRLESGVGTHDRTVCQCADRDAVAARLEATS